MGQTKVGSRPEPNKLTTKLKAGPRKGRKDCDEHPRLMGRAPPAKPAGRSGVMEAGEMGRLDRA